MTHAGCQLSMNQIFIKWSQWLPPKELGGGIWYNAKSSVSLTQKLTSNKKSGEAYVDTKTCKNKSISLTPLSKDEIYRISMEGKRGLDP